MEKNKFMALATILLAVAVLGGWTTYQSLKTGEDGLKEDIKSLNFEKTGTLTKNNPGMEKDAWYLVYEEPGSPALSAKLKFTERTTCRRLGEITDCPSISLENGMRVRVSGVKNDGEIKVDVLETIN